MEYPYDKLTRNALKTICKQRKLLRYHDLNKQQLVRVLIEHDILTSLSRRGK